MYVESLSSIYWRETAQNMLMLQSERTNVLRQLCKAPYHIGFTFHFIKVLFLVNEDIKLSITHLRSSNKVSFMAGDIYYLYFYERNLFVVSCQTIFTLQD